MVCCPGGRHQAQSPSFEYDCQASRVLLSAWRKWACVYLKKKRKPQKWKRGDPAGEGEAIQSAPSSDSTWDGGSMEVEKLQSSGAPAEEAGHSAKMMPHSAFLPDMLVRRPAGCLRNWTCVFSAEAVQRWLLTLWCRQVSTHSFSWIGRGWCLERRNICDFHFFLRRTNVSVIVPFFRSTNTGVISRCLLSGLEWAE